MESSDTNCGRPLVTRYRRRDIGEPELAFIRSQIAELGGRRGGRKALAETICKAWDWRQRQGGPALRACLDLLLRLQEWGHLELPPSLRTGQCGRKRHPLLPAELIPLAGLDVRAPEADLNSLVVRPVAPEEEEGWRLHMERYHYLGYRPIVGEQLKYAALLGDELVALLGWGSAALRAPLRERWVGWNDAARREGLHLVADNVRFLVLPRVRVPHLASKILAANLRRLSGDWQRRWGHPVHLAETFVDLQRFRGTCYRASNWVYLGQTAGRTKRGNAYLAQGSPKGLFVYPLHRRARHLLGGAVRAEVGGTQTGAGAPVQPPPATGEPRPVRDGSDLVLDRAESADTAAGEPAAPPQATGPVAAPSAPPALPTVQSDPPGTPGAVAPAPRTWPGNRRHRLDLALTHVERDELERRARGQAVEHREVVRARAILRVADGESFASAAAAVRLGHGAVRRWARRFVHKRLAGLEDEPRPGRPAHFPP